MITTEASAVAQTSSSLTGSDNEDEAEDEQDTPKRLGRTRRQNVFNTGKAKALPKWAKKGAIKCVLCYSNPLSQFSLRRVERSLLGDSDSESENNKPSHDKTPSKKRHAGGSGVGTPSGRNGKRARTRSRSRSLTPPPDLTLAEKMRAHMAIQFVSRHQFRLAQTDEWGPFWRI